jgi:hypothetical protein
VSIRTHTTTGRGAPRSRWVRAGAVAATIAVSGALALAAPVSASAEDHAESYAKGQFLSGSILGSDLAALVKTQFAEAHNDGTQGVQTSKDPLKVTALNAVTVGDGSQSELPLGDFIQLGTVSQFAQAKDDGVSTGASGAITDDGGIAAGTSTTTPPASATFDLSKLLGSQFASTITDLKLQLSQIAAQADGQVGEASGDYTLSGAKLKFTSPALAGLNDRIGTAVDQAGSSLGTLMGQSGDLVGAVNDLVQGVDPVLNLLGADATVTATIDTANLRDAIQPLLDSQYGDGAVTIDPTTGEVTIDLAKLQGGDLNDLPPNTELLNDQIINGVLDSITSTISTLADQVVDKVTTALHDATVNLSASTTVDIAQAPIVQNICHVVQVPGSDSGSGLDDTLGNVLGGLSGLLGTTDSGGTLGDVVGTTEGLVNQTVCETVSTLAAPLKSSANVHVSGTVDQLIDGSGATAGVNLSLLGIPNTSLSAGTIVNSLGDILNTDLFGSGGTVSKLTSALNDTVVNPVVSALVGPSTGPVSEALTKLLSIKVNVQELTQAGAKGTAASGGKMFTETAVRVTVGGGLGGTTLATVNLASATVGPNVTAVVPPTCTEGDCTPCTGAGCATCTTNCGPGGPSDNPTSTSIDRLATTGLSIAALVAAILALLAAGAYLVREGYKRRRPAPVG